MADIKKGSATTEFKVVVLNYIVGVLLIGAALWMKSNGEDTTTLMGIAVGFLGVNGLAYGAMRTVHKNKVAGTSEEE